MSQPDINIFKNDLIFTSKYTGEGNFQSCSALLGCVIITNKVAAVQGHVSEVLIRTKHSGARKELNTVLSEET